MVVIRAFSLWVVSTRVYWTTAGTLQVTTAA